MDILEILNKTVSFGLGTAVFSVEKLKEFADDMVQKGELNREDAKKFVDDVTKKADDEKTKMQEWFREQVAKIQPPFADADTVKKLQERVAVLEEKLGITAEVEECAEPANQTPDTPEETPCCQEDKPEDAAASDTSE